MVTVVLVLLVLATTVSVAYFGHFCLHYLRNIQHEDVDEVLRAIKLKEVIRKVESSSKEEKEKANRVMEEGSTIGDLHISQHNFSSTILPSSSSSSSSSFSSSTTAIVEFSHDYAEGRSLLQTLFVLFYSYFMKPKNCNGCPKKKKIFTRKINFLVKNNFFGHPLLYNNYNLREVCATGAYYIFV